MRIVPIFNAGEFIYAGRSLMSFVNFLSFLCYSIIWNLPASGKIIQIFPHNQRNMKSDIVTYVTFVVWYRFNFYGYFLSVNFPTAHIF